MSAIKSSVAQLNTRKELMSSEKMFNDIFRWILESAKKVQVHMSRKELYIFKNVFAAHLEIFYVIYLDCMDSSNDDMWKEIVNFYNANKENQILMFVWGKYLLASTENLSNKLENVPNDILTLCHTSPFDTLPMRKEFILQVLFDTFCNSDTYNESVKNTLLYTKIFSPWMRLLQLIDIDTSTDKLLLLEYIKSTCYI